MKTMRELTAALTIALTIGLTTALTIALLSLHRKFSPPTSPLSHIKLQHYDIFLLLSSVTMSIDCSISYKVSCHAYSLQTSLGILSCLSLLPESA
jgi:ABC-type transport system involved in multi-copper enzyme maturation permease subunit